MALSGPAIESDAGRGRGVMRGSHREGASSAAGGAWLLGWASFLMLLALWQAIAMIAHSRFLPSPWAVAGEIGTLALTGHLVADFAITLWRAVVGFAVAMVLGTAIGLVLGRSRIFDHLFNNWVIVGLNLPAIVIAILCYIWLGLTDTALIIAVVLNKTPLVITNIRQGVRAFDPGFDELAQAFRLGPRDRLRLIYLPQLMPFVLASARTGLSLVWKIVLVFEVLGSDSGVGFRVTLFFQFFDLKGILAYTTVFVVIVMAIEHLAFGPMERRLLEWRTDLV